MTCGKTMIFTNTNLIPTSLKPRIKDETPQKIPRIIHQTFKSNLLTDNLYEGVKTVIDMNPEYQYEFYDDVRMVNFVYNFDCTNFNFDKEQLINAFNDIKPAAGKADIFRYLIMYEYGGVYLDIDTKFIKPLSNCIDCESDIITNIVGTAYNAYDPNRTWTHLFPQWYLMYVPKTSIMKNIIEICVNAIHTRTPVANSEECLNLLERYTGACISNYVFRSIFKFKNSDQESRLKIGKYKIKHCGNVYNLSILPSKPHIFNESIVNKHFKDFESNRKELQYYGVDHWLCQNVF